MIVYIFYIIIYIYIVYTQTYLLEVVLTVCWVLLGCFQHRPCSRLFGPISAVRLTRCPISKERKLYENFLLHLSESTVKSSIVAAVKSYPSFLSNPRFFLAVPPRTTPTTWLIMQHSCWHYPTLGGQRALFFILTCKLLSCVSSFLLTCKLRS